MIKNKMIYIMYEYNNQNILKKMINEDPSLSFVNEKDAINVVKNLKCRAITIFDKLYPENLKLLDNPPWVIFYRGDLAILNNENMSLVIGNKNPSYYSLKVTDDCLKENIKEEKFISIAGNIFAKKTVKVNNEKSKNNLMVLPCGFNYDGIKNYEDIKSGDLVISFFSPKSLPSKEVYIQTLVYTICICNQVYVMELKKKSLLFEVIDVAIHLDKKIIVLPGNMYDDRVSGNNHLLNEGAELLYLKGSKDV